MGNLNKEVGVSSFKIEGRFVGFVGNLGEKPKRLRVATAEGECYIKLSKELRSSLGDVLQPGDWVEISGEQKRKYKTGELKLKAYQVKITAPTKQEKVFQPPVAAPKTKACVMVCQKSSCRKRGAGEVCQAVSESLRDRGLEDQVAIKGTGCMKECKKGPCVVFMPDKSRYTGVAPKEVSTLIEKHFAAKLKPEASQRELSPVT
ncbi:MAG TPA: NADH:ubiquinone oxidoreductase [Cyanobacteria bacterium UBA11049]|nr:NADH:ubiquinone oxidoreductase [Cyanobacteria bacterium UBA11049]